MVSGITIQTLLIILEFKKVVQLLQFQELLGTSEPKVNMDSMKKQAIIVMLQKAKSSIPEMVINNQRDRRQEASIKLVHIKVMHHPKLDHKLKVCFRDITCRDLMKPCQRILFRNHKLDPKFLELNQLYKAKNQTHKRK